MDRFTVGIDIGGTNTVTGLVDGSGNVVARETLPTAEYTDGAAFVEDIAQTILRLEAARNATIDGIGIGAPNAKYLTGTIGAGTANLMIKEEIPICRVLREKFGVYTVISNDADAAALGERIYGSAKECDNFILVTLGTGVGSGFFADGRLVHGRDCLAGELGHMTLIPGGRECTCGRRGCLETYTSARGICRTFRELAETNASLLPGNLDIGAATSREIGDLANQGNSVAVETFAKTAEYLAIGLANAVTFSNPEKIILMGGPTKVGDPLLQPLKRHFERNLLYIYKGSVSIELSRLDDNDAAIIGAAALTKIKPHTT
ncbi:MAG: ROK family protein [Bacteroidales bacterium]|nr:ROK family protein [Bacteroidales bacterium]